MLWIHGAFVFELRTSVDSSAANFPVDKQAEKISNMPEDSAHALGK